MKKETKKTESGNKKGKLVTETLCSVKVGNQKENSTVWLEHVTKYVTLGEN